MATQMQLEVILVGNWIAIRFTTEQPSKPLQKHQVVIYEVTTRKKIQNKRNQLRFTDLICFFLTFNGIRFFCEGFRFCGEFFLG